MKKAWQVSVYAIMVLGVLHVVFTPKFYSEFNTDAVWFISCGFFLIAQGFINILAWQLQRRSGYLMAVCVNLFSLLLVLALLWLRGEVQAYVGVVLALVALAGSGYFVVRGRGGEGVREEVVSNES
jgi:hypothetical protein